MAQGPPKTQPRGSLKVRAPPQPGDHPVPLHPQLGGGSAVPKLGQLCRPVPWGGSRGLRARRGRGLGDAWHRGHGPLWPLNPPRATPGCQPPAPCPGLGDTEPHCPLCHLAPGAGTPVRVPVPVTSEEHAASAGRGGWLSLAGCPCTPVLRTQGWARPPSVSPLPALSPCPQRGGAASSHVPRLSSSCPRRHCHCHCHRHRHRQARGHQRGCRAAGSCTRCHPLPAIRAIPCTLPPSFVTRTVTCTLSPQPITHLQQHPVTCACHPHPVTHIVTHPSPKPCHPHRHPHCGICAGTGTLSPALSPAFLTHIPYLSPVPCHPHPVTRTVTQTPLPAPCRCAATCPLSPTRCPARCDPPVTCTATCTLSQVCTHPPTPIPLLPPPPAPATPKTTHTSPHCCQHPPAVPVLVSVGVGLSWCCHPRQRLCPLRSRRCRGLSGSVGIGPGAVAPPAAALPTPVPAVAAAPCPVRAGRGGARRDRGHWGDRDTEGGGRTKRAAGPRVAGPGCHRGEMGTRDRGRDRDRGRGRVTGGRDGASPGSAGAGCKTDTAEQKCQGRPRELFPTSPHDMEWDTGNGMAWHGVAHREWYTGNGMAWHGTAWHGMGRHGTASVRRGQA